MSENDSAEGRDGIASPTHGEPALSLEGSADDRLDVVAAQGGQEAGYPRDVVDELLSRASQTVETLLDQVRAAHDEIARLESAQAELEGRLESTSPRTPEELVGDVLVSAQRAAEGIVEQAHVEAGAIAAAARRDVTPLLGEAKEALRQASALHHEAVTAVEGARAEAASILDAAKSEREELIAGAVAEATRRRSELELSNARLETAIKGLRTEWAGRAAEALARLEGIAIDLPAAASDTSSPPAIETAPEPAAEIEPSSEPAEPEAELPYDRSPESESAAGEQPAAGEQEEQPVTYDLHTRLAQGRDDSVSPDGPF